MLESQKNIDSKTKPKCRYNGRKLRADYYGVKSGINEIKDFCVKSVTKKELSCSSGYKYVKNYDGKPEDMCMKL